MAKRHFNIKTTLEQELEILERYQNGETIKSLIESYEMGRKAIRSALERQGLTLDRNHYAKRLKALSDKQEIEAVKLYQSGMGLNPVARHFGLRSVKSITKALKNNNVSPRENRTYYFNQHAFDSIDDEHAHYWLGFIYADGTTGRGALRIGLSPKDRKQIEKIKDFMNGDMQIMQTDLAVSIGFHSVYLANQLIDKGIIVRRGRFDLTVPHIKLNNHFIRGYLDGDGCISTNEQVVFLGQVDILTWIRDVLNKECNASMSKIRPRRGIHEISWGGIHQARRIVDWLYKDATIWMQRKRDVAINWRS